MSAHCMKSVMVPLTLVLAQNFLLNILIIKERKIKMIWLELWAKFQVIGSIAGVIAIIGVIIYAIYLNRGK